MNVLTTTKHLKRSCLLVSSAWKEAAERRVRVKQELMHMYGLPRSSQGCVQTRSDCVRRVSVNTVRCR